MREKINSQLKAAQKAKDQLTVSALRMINAAIKDRDIAARGEGKPSPVGDEEILQLLQKMVKQRKESLDIFEKAGRAELAAKEQSEISIIESFMPRQMNDAEIQAAVAEVIKATGAQGIKDMGKVMAALKERHAGSMDFAKGGKAVKDLLG